jgi:hypothetical protein
MRTVDEITTAIERLSADDLARVQAWLAEYAERLWDEQIERDGCLDALIDGALEEHGAGRPLEPSRAPAYDGHHEASERGSGRGRSA